MDVTTNWIDLTALRSQLNEEQRADIQRHLIAEISFDSISAGSNWIRDQSAYPGPLKDWQVLVREWEEFVSAYRGGDKVWTFDTTEGPKDSFVSGEEGYAVVREGAVVAWFVNAINA